jgi:hypothetical protein
MGRLEHVQNGIQELNKQRKIGIDREGSQSSEKAVKPRGMQF